MPTLERYQLRMTTRQKVSSLLPFNRATGEYVRHVFSVGPGAGALLGFFAVIAFLPATVRCRKVGKLRELNRGNEAIKLYQGCICLIQLRKT